MAPAERGRVEPGAHPFCVPCAAPGLRPDADAAWIVFPRLVGRVRDPPGSGVLVVGVVRGGARSAQAGGVRGCWLPVFRDATPTPTGCPCRGWS